MDRVQTSPVWKNRNFLYIWLGQGISNLGDWFSYVAVVTLVYRMTGSEAMVGSVMIAQLLPALLFAPFAGSLGDRINRKYLMVACDLVRALAVAGLLVVNAPWQLYPLVFILGTGSAFFNPALRATIPLIVGSRQLTVANSAVSTVFNLALMFGPLVAGLVLAAFGLEWAFIIDSLSFLISALFLVLTAVPSWRAIQGRKNERKSMTGGVSKRNSYWSDFMIGLAYIGCHKTVMAAVVSLFIVVFTAAGLNVVEVFLAVEVLGAGEKGYGYLLSAWGVGMVFGSLAVPGLAQKGRFSLVQVFLASHWVSGIGLAITALSGSLMPALIGYAIGGWGNGAGNVAQNTMLQMLVPNKLQGRIFATVGMAVTGGIMASTVLLSLLATVFRVQALFLLGAGGCLVAWAAGAVLVRQDRLANGKNNLRLA